MDENCPQHPKHGQLVDDHSAYRNIIEHYKHDGGEAWGGEEDNFIGIPRQRQETFHRVKMRERK